MLALLRERDLAPLPFHQSFRNECVNRGLQGIFPERLVASYMGLSWPNIQGEYRSFIGPKETHEISLHVLCSIHHVLL
jgi:hypothetical protein